MKSLHLFNSLTGRKEHFKPHDPDLVTIYCCGPTVYDKPHLGHAKTYILLDVLRRVLDHMGYNVRCVMNITDLDDKIISGGGPRIAHKYEQLFFDTMDQLNVKRPDFAPRVTEFVKIADEFTQTCSSKGLTYVGPDASIYFDTARYLEENGRVFPVTQVRDSYLQPTDDDRRDPRDFVLWKSKEWTDVRGAARLSMPGWHTECAAMATYFFGKHVDIHLGGIDLQFPHHENEISLGRAHSNTKQWVGYCLHTGHLHIKGMKMSKSLKNFITVQDVLAGGSSPLIIRYMFLKHAYGKSMEFSWDEFGEAKRSYEKFMYTLNKIKSRCLEGRGLEETSVSSHLHDSFLKFKKKLEKCLMNDLDTPRALKRLEDYAKTLSQEKGSSWLWYYMNRLIWMTDHYFGLWPTDPKTGSDEHLFPILKALRSRVRECALEDMDETQRKYVLLKACDRARNEVKLEGYVMEDGGGDRLERPLGATLNLGS